MEPAGVLRNAEGRAARLGRDGVHYYCGAKVGPAGYWNGCTTCDGVCGPGNGCNCKACFQLDMAAGATATVEAHVKVNGEGRAVQRGTDPGRSFYCGGRAGYWTGCRSGCDGMCGPTSGCSCESCHELSVACGLPGSDSRYASHISADAKAKDEAAAAARAKAKKDPAAAVAAYAAGFSAARRAKGGPGVKSISPGCIDPSLELHHGSLALGDARAEAWLWLKTSLTKDAAAAAGTSDVAGAGIVALPAAVAHALLAAAGNPPAAGGSSSWSAHRHVVVPVDVSGSLTAAGRVDLVLQLRVAAVGRARGGAATAAGAMADASLYISGSLQPDAPRRSFAAFSGLSRSGVAAVATAVLQAAGGGDKAQRGKPSNSAAAAAAAATAPPTPAAKAAAATLAAAATGDLQTAVGPAVLEVAEGALPEAALFGFAQALIAAYTGARARVAGAAPAAAAATAAATADFWLTRLARLSVRSAGLLAATLIAGPPVGYEEEELRPLLRSRLLESGPVLLPGSGAAQAALASIPFADVTGFGLQWDDALGRAAASLRARSQPALAAAAAATAPDAAAAGDEPPALHLSITAAAAPPAPGPVAPGPSDVDRWLHELLAAGTESPTTAGSRLLAWLQVRPWRA